MHRISGNIYLAVIETQKIGEEFKIERAIQNIVDRWGVNEFDWEVDTNVWLRVNPDSRKWSNPGSHKSEIAVYVPQRIQAKVGKRSAYAGITFDDEMVLFTKLPDWQPIPVRDFTASRDCPTRQQ